MTEIDPFAGAEKAPSVSFKNAPVGTTYTGTVTDVPKLIQSRDFNTGEPAFWPASRPGEEPNPKMSVVINFDVEGEPRSLWAQKPSAMFQALADAQRAAGAKIEPGAVLSVKFTGEKEHTDPEKIREVIEKRMFSQVEDLLPVISFSSKGDKDTEKKHTDFVARMVSRGYTARQTRRLVEWYMRVNKAG